MRVKPASAGFFFGDNPFFHASWPQMPRPLPKSIDETHKLLGEADYVADRSLATALYLSLSMQRPLFLEGEAGVGKTEIAKVIAAALGRELIRLQCYEGLDIAQAAYEWNYSRQMIEIRLAEASGEKSKEKISQDIFAEKFLVKRSLARALEGTKGAAPVLLIDELDRTDEPFEAYLLEVLSDWQITIPEIGTLKAAEPPIVVITSNRTREIHEAPLLLSLGGLPGCGEGTRDPAAQGAEGRCHAIEGSGQFRATPAQHRPVQAAWRRGDHRLGELPGGAGPDHPRSGNGQQHPRRAAQVPGRHRAHRRRGGRAPGDRSEKRRGRRARLKAAATLP
jgi:hypothetical protein